MINVVITLTEAEFEIIEKYAKANNLLPEEYARNIVSSWARGHMKAEIQKILNNMPLEEAKKLLKKEKL
jgi:hypothetical protein